MAINAYCGVQGSGKSYEVVSSVIIPAIASGRRVVTNIAGLNYDLICDYIEKKSLLSAGVVLGEIVSVDNDRIVQPDFFPFNGNQSVVLPGDLVCIDEVWRFWDASSKLSAEHRDFVRMHRHYAHPETGQTCDMAIITQDVSGLNRFIRNVIEFTFRMKKHKSFGLNSAYRVDIFPGCKLTQTSRIEYIQRTYDKNVFPLYSSYDSNRAKETNIDDRVNIFRSFKFWALISFILFLLSYSGYTFYGFFHYPEKKQIAEVKNVNSSSQKSTFPTSDKTSLNPPENLPLSDDWRISGLVSDNSGRFVVLFSNNGKIRLESPSLFSGTGFNMTGVIDGKRVYFWSGSQNEISKKPI